MDENETKIESEEEVQGEEIEKEDAILEDPLTKREKNELELAAKLCANGKYEYRLAEYLKRKKILWIVFFVLLAASVAIAIVFLVKSAKANDVDDASRYGFAAVVSLVIGAISSVVHSVSIGNVEDEILELKHQREIYYYYQNLLHPDEHDDEAGEDKSFSNIIKNLRSEENYEKDEQEREDHESTLRKIAVVVCLIAIFVSVISGIVNSELSRRKEAAKIAFSSTTEATTTQEETEAPTTKYYRYYYTTTTKYHYYPDTYDEYDVNDYYDPEDFYYDHEDDFYDYDEAEDYYYDNIDD